MVAGSSRPDIFPVSLACLSTYLRKFPSSCADLLCQVSPAVGGHCYVLPPPPLRTLWLGVCSVMANDRFRSSRACTMVVLCGCGAAGPVSGGGASRPISLPLTAPLTPALYILAQWYQPLSPTPVSHLSILPVLQLLFHCHPLHSSTALSTTVTHTRLPPLYPPGLAAVVSLLFFHCCSGSAEGVCQTNEANGQAGRPAATMAASCLTMPRCLCAQQVPPRTDNSQTMPEAQHRKQSAGCAQHSTARTLSCRSGVVSHIC